MGRRTSPISVLGKFARLSSFAILAAIGVVMVLPAASGAKESAAGAAASDYFHQGLGHHASTPAWAKDKPVHFLAPPGKGPGSEIRRFSKHPVAASSSEEGLTADTNNTYLGGPIQANPHVHLIYWGSNWNSYSHGPEIRSALNQLFSGVSGSGWQGILTQYFEAPFEEEERLISHSVTFNPATDVYTDTQVPAPSKVTYTKVTNEISAAQSAMGWPKGSWYGNFSINDELYVVLTAPGTTYESSFLGQYCGFHSADNYQAYAFLPSTADEPFRGMCGEASGTQASKFASHEYAEAVTDPIPQSAKFGEGKPAWETKIYAEGKVVGMTEIADLCQMQPTGELANGATVVSLRDNYHTKCMLSDPSPPQFDLSMDGVKSELAGQAVLEATIEPAGHPTSYKFAWGKVTEFSGCERPAESPYPERIYGHFEHFEPAAYVSAGSGTGPVHVSLPISGLEAHVQYCAKLMTQMVSDINGPDAVGVQSEHRAFTPVWPPQVTTGAASIEGASGTNATLHATVNPNAVKTTYQFEYGTTEYKVGDGPHGTKIPSSPGEAGSGTTDVQVSQTLESLAPATTYHFRVVASSAEGTSYGEDQSFTTWGKWSTQTTPNSPPAQTNSFFTDVSCPSVSLCLGVARDNWTSRAFVEKWNGSTWSILGNSLTQASANAIACTSATSCLLVGRWDSGDPKSWTLNVTTGGTAITSSPAIPSEGKGVALTDLSCTSSSACTAVGTYETNGGKTQTLAERWNGSSWSLQTTPNPETGTASLKSVSCDSASSCTAVGLTSLGGTFAERWNGTSWAISTTPNPAEATNSVLSGVSCTSASNCIAVGDYRKASGVRLSLAERWNGSSWAVLSTPNPAESKNSYLRSVSCATSTSCEAVGDYATETVSGVTTKGKTLTLRWNGTEWAIQSSSNSTYDASSLTGVSCTSATACTAVGNGRGIFGEPAQVPLAEQYNGTAWSTQTTPNSPPAQNDSSFRDVSCSSASLCLAVARDNWTSRAFVEKWNGSTWSILGNSLTQASANAIACTSATSCLLVGRWDSGEAKSWTLNVTTGGTAITSSPVIPSEGKEVTLADLSCTSSSACTAVGTYQTNGGKTQTLAERWNGSSWSLQTTPNPETGTASLKSVSCDSASSCTAVGLTSLGGTFAERWNGTSWAISTTPNPAEATNSVLSGVSCTSASNCIAVGDYKKASGVRLSLAERWNGSSWAVLSTPNPAESKNSYLRSVSCATSTSCEAVGDYATETISGVSVKGKTLTLRWNGTEWAIQSSPASSDVPSLLGVSCASTTACTAVGGQSSLSEPTQRLPLAEQYG